MGIKHCPVIVLNFCISFEFIILYTTASCCLFSPQITYLPLPSINDVPSRFINKREVIQWGLSILLPSNLLGHLYLLSSLLLTEIHFRCPSVRPITQLELWVPFPLAFLKVLYLQLFYFASLHHSIHCSVKTKKSSKIPYLPYYAISLLTSIVKFLLKMYTGNHLSVLQILNLVSLPGVHKNYSCRITNNLFFAKSKEGNSVAVLFLFQFSQLNTWLHHPPSHLNQKSQP